MTKSKKIILSITIPIAIILVAIMCLIAVYGFGFLKDIIAHRNWTRIDYCNEAWDMEIPKATIEYTFSNRSGNGDGETYTVCGYSSRPDKFLTEFETDFKEEYVKKYNKIIDFLQSSGIDKSKLVEFDENYIYLFKTKNSNCTLILAYNEQTNKLYIFENFM